MRIEAGSLLGYRIKMVWHCEERRRMMDVVWVDTDTAEYGQVVIVGRTFPPHVFTRQARRIVLKDEVIYINPLDDNNEQQETEHGKENPRAVEHARA